MTDRFCAHCGQNAHTHRFTVGHLLHEIPHSIWHVDKGFLFTLRGMLRGPGAVIREYLAGQRVRHFRPLSYVLLLVGSYAFLYSALHIKPYDARNPALSPVAAELTNQLTHFVAKYMAWLNVASLPITALLMKWLLRRTGLNYAEYLLAAAFVSGTSFFFQLCLLPLAYATSGTAAFSQTGLLMSGLVLLYRTWAYADLLRPFQRSAVGRYVRGAAVSLLSYVVSIALAYALFYAFEGELIREVWREQRQHALQAAAPTKTPAPAPSQNGR